jgi:hypothetical protein
MPNAYKILGQVNPSAASETDLYTVPTSTSTVCSSLSICNLSGTQGMFRVSITFAGAPTDRKDYLYYDILLAGNDTFIATIGITIAERDVIRVYSDTPDFAFQVWGTEIN